MPAGSIDAAAWAPVVAALLTAGAGFLSAWWLAASKYRKERADKATQVLNHNRDPLLRAVFDLQSRIYNIAARRFLVRYWKEGDEEERAYARDSTLWLFGQYLGWTEILRREVQYLDLGSRATNREVQRRLSDVSAAMASDSHGRDGTFIVFRSDQRAIGEFMVTQRETQDGKRPDCLGYSEFVEALARLGGLAAGGQRGATVSPVLSWSERFAADMDSAAGGSEAWQERLVRVQRRLINLLDLLDPECLRYPNPDLRGKLPWPGTERKPPRKRVAHFVWPWDDPWSGVEDWAGKHGLSCTSTSTTERSYRGSRGPLGGHPEFHLAFEGDWFTIRAWTDTGRGQRRVDGSLRSGRTRLALDELLERYDRPLVNGATRPFRAAAWIRSRSRSLPGLRPVD